MPAVLDTLVAVMHLRANARDRSFIRACATLVNIPPKKNRTEKKREARTNLNLDVLLKHSGPQDSLQLLLVRRPSRLVKVSAGDGRVASEVKLQGKTHTSF